ncbi:MAG: hypothetical protein LBK23_06610 [Oscillospiraceae bacterium]|jgi:hypothetical protein|nr:hypothetical protein [Oscillospiraceae bacterium]
MEFLDQINLAGLWEQNWFMFLVIGAALAGSVVFSIVRLRGARASNKSFLAEHPDAAKVYLVTKALVATEAARVHSVNGGKPENFFEGSKNGFYLAPGRSSVEISYTHSRPGVLHKSVTTSTGVVKKELVTEANKSYFLGFDRKAENFTFELTGN